MSLAHPTFAEMLARVRDGDEQAAAELVRRYEPQIRRVIRTKLTDPKLRRQFDSIDICQSVLADFFVHARLGGFDLQTPKQLLALLKRMAQNKFIDHVREQHADCRDLRRLEAVEVTEMKVRGATPSAIVAGRELLALVRAALTEEERSLADHRAIGRSWAEIAAITGQPPDALRMRLARAAVRVKKELGIGDSETG